MVSLKEGAFLPELLNTNAYVIGTDYQSEQRPAR